MEEGEFSEAREDMAALVSFFGRSLLIFLCIYLVVLKGR
jgi:hypothetical protein